MRRNPTKHIEQHRIREGPWASSPGDGANGAFVIPVGGVLLQTIASDGTHWEEDGLLGDPWEHVSVSLALRCPTWAEMDYVKRLFWRDNETVMQLHVPRKSHINLADTCLHLWKPVGIEIPSPPLETVGPVGLAGQR